MKHISKRSRSFLILIIVVLLTVYAALLLLDIQHDYLLANEPAPSNTRKMISQTNKDSWELYEDSNFPFTISLPKDWVINGSGSLTTTYQYALSPADSDKPIQIFISKTSFVGIKGLASADIITPQGNKGIAIGDTIFAFKKGDYYYTFDATLAPTQLDTFKGIVNSAIFK